MSYRNVNERWPNFEMLRVAEQADVYPMFSKLFAKREGAA